MKPVRLDFEGLAGVLSFSSFFCNSISLCGFFNCRFSRLSSSARFCGLLKFGRSFQELCYEPSAHGAFLSHCLDLGHDWVNVALWRLFNCSRNLTFANSFKNYPDRTTSLLSSSDHAYKASSPTNTHQTRLTIRSLDWFTINFELCILAFSSSLSTWLMSNK